MAPPPKKQRLESSGENGLTEKDVGILKFISADIPGFSGIMKQRYTDFQVNEVDLQGNVVHLQDLVENKEAVPTENEGTGAEAELNELTESESKPAESKPNNSRRPPPDITKFREELDALLTPEVVDECLQLFTTGSKLRTQESFENKETRTKIHQLIREAFEGRLSSTTSQENKFVVTLATKRDRTSLSRDKNKSAGLKYLRFCVYKENKETMEIANHIGKLLRVQPKSLAFAGTKDRRGITVQLFSLPYMDINRVASLNNALKYAKLGNFHYHKEPLRLGSLKGNQFFIAIRNLSSTEHVDKALCSLRDNGFINYFGMQRFGTFSVSTHTIGRFILAGDFDSAVEGILMPQDLTLDKSREAREVWKATRDPAQALALMPRYCLAEHSILTTLKSSPSSINALLRVPRNLKLMYVHSYQSFIWNQVATKRVELGLDIQEGDLVLADSPEDEFVRARPVTPDEISSGAKTIFDVVLPTPGFDVEYPENLKSEYESIMAKDNIDCHKMRRNTREFSLSGSYRAFLAKPLNLEWWLQGYSNPEDQLIYSDLDMLEGKKALREPYQLCETEGNLNALVLRMTLGTSQYATMALREAMKVDTGRQGELFE